MYAEEHHGYHSGGGIGGNGGKGSKSGKGGKGGKGGGYGGCGGRPNWGDPVWRASKLASMEAECPRVIVDGRTLGPRLEAWRSGSMDQGDELHLSENFGRDGVAAVQALCRTLGLFAQSYGKGKSTVVVVARRPLPRYRADLDARHGRQEAGLWLSPTDEDHVAAALERFGAPAAPSRYDASVAAARESDHRPSARLAPVPAVVPAVAVVESWEDLPNDNEGNNGEFTCGVCGTSLPEDLNMGACMCGTNTCFCQSCATWSEVHKEWVCGKGTCVDDCHGDDKDGARGKSSAEENARVKVGAAESVPLTPTVAISCLVSGPAPDAKWDEALRSAQARRSASSDASAVNAARRRLPAFAARETILAAIAGHAVVLVKGETGSGKTTQVPQFLLEEADANGRGSKISIVCTQPRRIAAVSVAERVVSERASCERGGEKSAAGDAVGGTVGYTIRGESRRSSATRLLFCTTGVLLRQLATDQALSGVTHVIIDEIHERGLNEDFLLICIKDLLRHRPGLRVVLMSATIQADQFARYFGDATPVVEIPGITFPVREVWLEDLVAATGHVIPPSPARRGRVGAGHRGRRGCADERLAAGGAAEGSAPASEAGGGDGRSGSLSNWTGEHHLPELVALALTYVMRQSVEDSGPNTAVLVFLSGFDEIKAVKEHLEATLGSETAFHGDQRTRIHTRKLLILPLHSALPASSHRAVFQHPPAGTVKVILATNIAETSITIDDVGFVVDCGFAKEKTYDSVNDLESLLPTLISRSAARQRRGRAGRTAPGTCVRLYPKFIHDVAMREFAEPEILRTPLASLCLQVKSLSITGSGSAPGSTMVRPFLARALEPPPPQSVDNALALLEAIGAVDESTEALTPLGRHLAKLPLDPRLGKMLVVSCCLRCLGPALTIAAALAHKPPFVMPMEGKERADAAKERFANGSCSDHLATLNAFGAWQTFRRGSACSSRSDEERWCWDNYLSLPALRTMEDLREQFTGLLRDAGFIPSPRSAANASGAASDAPDTNDTEEPSQRADETDSSEGLHGGIAHGRGRAICDDLPSSVNGLGGEASLVRAVVCAGLFPRVAAVSAGGKRHGGKGGHGVGGKGSGARNNARVRVLWRTREDGKVDPHPSSVNAFPLGPFEYAWMVYGDKVRSPGGTMVRDSTNVSDLALLLFGGDLKDDDAAATPDTSDGRARMAKVSMLQGYVTFAAPRRTLDLVQGLRRAMDRHLDDRIRDPTRAHMAASAAAGEGPGSLTDAVLELLRSEDGYGDNQPSFGGDYGPPLKPLGRHKSGGRGSGKTRDLPDVVW